MRKTLGAWGLDPEFKLRHPCVDFISLHMRTLLHLEHHSEPHMIARPPLSSRP